MKVKQLLIVLFFILGLASAQAAPVNINTADSTTLANSLKGVGKTKAEAIVAYREMNGEFKSAEELTRVKGIGKKILADNMDDIRLED